MKVHTPLNIAFSIWFLTVMINALLTITVFLNFEHIEIGNLIGAFCFLFIIMLLASFPALIVLILLLRKCRDSGVTGRRTLLIVYATGIASAVVVFYLFVWLFRLGYLESEILKLLGCAVLSAVLSITTQARPILNISAVEPE